MTALAMNLHGQGRIVLAAMNVVVVELVALISSALAEITNVHASPPKDTDVQNVQEQFYVPKQSHLTSKLLIRFSLTGNSCRVN